MAGMCDTCHAGCCRGYNLLITGFDALKLSHELSLPVVEFVSLLTIGEDQGDKFRSVYDAIRVSDAGFEKKKLYLALKRVESRLIPGTFKCYFLNEWQRELPAPNRAGHPGEKVIGRCSVYNSRPLMCRTYPTSLHQNTAMGFIATPKPVEAREKHEIYTLCPEKWSAAQFSTDHTTVLHNLVIDKFENEFYNQAVRYFNETPRPFEEFLPMMARLYRNRFQTAPELVSKPAATVTASFQADPPQ